MIDDRPEAIAPARDGVIDVGRSVRPGRPGIVEHGGVRAQVPQLDLGADGAGIDAIEGGEALGGAIHREQGGRDGEPVAVVEGGLAGQGGQEPGVLGGEPGVVGGRARGGVGPRADQRVVLEVLELSPREGIEGGDL